MADRNLVVKIIGDDRSLQQAFRRSGNAGKSFGNEMERAGRGALAASLSFRGLGRSLTFASAQFLGGAGVVFALKQVVSEASRVQEETEKTGIVFARSAPQVQAWAKTLANSFGIAEGAALEATGRFGNMLRPLGFAPAAAAKMSEALVQLSADMASFNNTKPDVVLQALSSGLAGQVRPLRQFGVFLSAARIQEEALADGIAKRGQKLTQAQTVQAAYNIILKDTKLQQGDVARNTESLSVAQSKLTAAVQDLEARLGKALLPVLTNYVNKASKWLGDTKNQERIQRTLTNAVKTTVGVIRDFVGVVKTLTGVFGGVKKTLEIAFGIAVVTKIRNIVTAINFIGPAATRNAAQAKAAFAGLTFSGLAGGAAAKGGGGLLGGISGFAASVFGANPDQLDTRKVKQGDLLLTQFKDPAGKWHTVKVDPIAKVSPAFTEFIKNLRKQLAPKPIGGRNAGGAGITGSFLDPVTSGKSRFTASQRNQFFDASIGRARDLVQDQTSIKGQIGALQKIAALIQARIATTKDVTRKLTLEAELRDVWREIKADQTQLAADIKDALDARNAAIAQLTQAKQFKALGLGPTGDDIIPGVGNLKKQSASLLARLQASGGLTPKLKALFAGVGKVLSGSLGKVTEETRAKIAELFATIRQGFDKGTKDVAAGPLTKTTSLAGKVGQAFAGLGLSREQQKALSSRLTGFNSAGVGLGSRGAGLAGAGGPVVIHNTLMLDGHVVARNQNTINDKRKGRNSTPRRGRR